MNYFATNIRYLRKQRKLSQEEIAERMHFTRGTWHNYESGNTQPEIDKILNIAKHFHVNVGELLESDLSKKDPPEQPDPSVVNEDDAPYQKNIREEVNLLILRQLNTLVGDIGLIKNKLGL